MIATSARRLSELYAQGRNISEYLRNELGVSENTREIIDIAYDLQAGSYTELMGEEGYAAHKAQYTSELARVISSLCSPATILEAGVGEATTLCGVLTSLPRNVTAFGFDLSWSRLAYAHRWLRSHDRPDCTLCTGDLEAIPFLDDSIDVVYTSHSIEPNGGRETPILQELYRVTRSFLILLEPAYEFAGPEARQRMESHGYCRDLGRIARDLGYDVLRHELFGISANPLNPTGILIIRKETANAHPGSFLACPKTRTPLKQGDGVYFSPESLTLYPVVAGFPCLRVEHGIFASKYPEGVHLT